ncbi:MAG TPA: cupredoxin domain-containing protein [Pseudomonadales bacterium]|nr:cupredoxin domain-containing protein [Pseudomonadales bacterium]
MVRPPFIVLLLGVLTAAAAAAAEPGPALISITQRQFAPQELQLPAGVKVRLLVKNTDALPAEFESYDLSREVIVPPHGSVTVFIGPLAPGKYQFFNDFNPDAKGWIVVTKP